MVEQLDGPERFAGSSVEIDGGDGRAAIEDAQEYVQDVGCCEQEIGINDPTLPPPRGPSRTSASTLGTSVGTGVGFPLRDSSASLKR